MIGIFKNWKKWRISLKVGNATLRIPGSPAPSHDTNRLCRFCGKRITQMRPNLPCDWGHLRSDGFGIWHASSPCLNSDTFAHPVPNGCLYVSDEVEIPYGHLVSFYGVEKIGIGVVNSLAMIPDGCLHVFGDEEFSPDPDTFGYNCPSGYYYIVDEVFYGP